VGRKATGLKERQPGYLDRGDSAFLFEAEEEMILVQIILTAVERKQKMQLPN
jgi:hypothetical protein